ncbi:MAG: VanZ family protein [Clostridia bacterium]|nr:VanZ family protein [Clostridia bacterium]
MKKINKSQGGINKSLFSILFFTYLIIIAWVIIFKCNVTADMQIAKNQATPLIDRFLVNIIPFQSFIVSVGTSYRFTYAEFFMNFFVFIPMGLGLPFFLGKKKHLTLYITAAITLAVEIFQLFSGWGGFDTTDLILNFLGGLVGYALYNKLRPRLSDATVNKITVILLCVFLPFAIAVSVVTALNFPI